MDFIEVVKLAFDAVRINKLRSVLTALGVIIGVAAIILLTSIGSGLQSYVSKQFENLGTNSIFIAPGKVQFGSGGGPPRSINKLTFGVVRSLERERKGYITDVSPIIQIAVTTVFGNKSKVTTLVGAKANYFSSFGVYLGSGRKFSDSDDRSARKVAVIGASVANDLYGIQNPLGKKVKLSGKSFTVIGILKKQGNVGGVDVDNQVLVPINSARSLTGADQVNSIVVKTQSAKTVDQAKKQIEHILSRTLSSDDYTILSQEQLLSSILQILGVLTFALGGIAAISLVVGGVGISNIMLVSVTERTREIGLRKAVGAQPQDILSQFLIEAVILSLFGGIIGVTIGYLGSLALSLYLQTAVPLWAVMLGLGFSTAVGVVFGVIPAIRASRLEPIEALRHE